MFWYTREKQDGTDPIAAELRSVKEREEELMLEAGPPHATWCLFWLLLSNSVLGRLSSPSLPLCV